MGALDDAIRQHLALKREHGASEEELTRQEAEALGPARREALAAEEQPAAELYEEPAGETHLPDTPLDDADDLFAEPAFGEEGAFAEESPFAEEMAAEDPLPDHEPEAALYPHPEPPAKIEGDPLMPHEEPPPHEPPFHQHDEEAEIGGEGGDTPARGFEAIDQSTEEHPPPAAEEGGEGEDVLEGTPDFLEETPEHDKLWFEQKPPRDFDFDE